MSAALFRLQLSEGLEPQYKLEDSRTPNLKLSTIKNSYVCDRHKKRALQKVTAVMMRMKTESERAIQRLARQNASAAQPAASIQTAQKVRLRGDISNFSKVNRIMMESENPRKLSTFSGYSESRTEARSKHQPKDTNTSKLHPLETPSVMKLPRSYCRSPSLVPLPKGLAAGRVVLEVDNDGNLFTKQVLQPRRKKVNRIHISSVHTSPTEKMRRLSESGRGFLYDHASEGGNRIRFFFCYTYSMNNEFMLFYSSEAFR
jgi:hypothetical protein